MNRKTWMLIASAVLTSISTARGTAAEPGFYLSAAVGRAEEDAESIGTNIALGFPPTAIFHIDPDRVDVDESDAAWSVAVGYRINSYLAAEVEYVDFGTADISEHYNLAFLASPPLPSEITRGYGSKVTGPALSVLGCVPIGNSFELFLRAGVLFADREFEIPLSVGLDDTFATTVWLGGAGLGWSFANRWTIRAEYQRTGRLEESFLAGETELERMALSLLFRL
jgi:hypothetical protein